MKVKDIKDTEEKDWLVLMNWHERYSFSSDLSIYRKMTLLDLIKSDFYLEIDEDDEIEVEERYEMENSYLVDKSYHNTLDTKYEAPELKNSKVKKVGFNTYCFIPLNSFLENECFRFSWGFTNSKFGLLDREGEF